MRTSELMGRQALRRGLPFTLVALFALAPMRLEACSCGWPPGPRESMLAADAVFLGEVVSTRVGPRDAWDMFGGELEAELDVKVGWKGVAGGRVTVRTSSGGASCGYPFATGGAYLVHATRGDDGQLHTHLCSRSMPWWIAFYDVQFLGDPIPQDPGPLAPLLLTVQLHSWSSTQQISACNALGLMPGSAERSVPALAALVTRTRDDDVRRGALSALGQLGSVAGGAAPAIAQALRDPNPEVALAAATALERIGPAAAAVVPALLAALDDDSAAQALVRERDSLPGTARDEAEKIDRRLMLWGSFNRQVTRTLGAFGPAAGREAIDALLPRLDGWRAPEFARTLRAMGAGGEATSALRALLDEASDPRSVRTIKRESLMALAELGPDAVAALPSVIPLLRHQDVVVRHAAVNALGAMGPAAEPAVPALIEALDQVEISHFAVVDALASIGSPAGAATLARSARMADDPAVSSRARRGLQDMGLDPDAVEPSPGKPHGVKPIGAPRDPEHRVASAPAMDGAVRRLAPVSSFDAIGGGLCGRVAAHPDGIVAADFCRDGGVAIIDVPSGRVLATVKSPDPRGASLREYSYFGAKVAVAGATTLVAAPSFGGSAIKSGAVYAFRADGSRVRRIDNPVPASDGRFGQSLAAGPDFFVATVSRTSANPGGALIVLGPAGEVQRVIQAPEGVRFWESELAVAGRRGDVIACAEQGVLGDGKPGEVLLFDRRSGEMLRALHGPAPADDDGFGTKVAAFGEARLLVGAEGAVHVIDLATGAIEATAVNPEPGEGVLEYPAAIVAIDDQRLAVGVRGSSRTLACLFDERGALVAIAECPVGSLGLDNNRVLAFARDRLVVSASDRRYSVFELPPRE